MSEVLVLRKQSEVTIIRSEKLTTSHTTEVISEVTFIRTEPVSCVFTTVPLTEVVIKNYPVSEVVIIRGSLGGGVTNGDKGDVIVTNAGSPEENWEVPELDFKADKTYVDSELAEKADITYVDASLAVKADKTYVDSELSEKADITYVDAGLATKVDTDDANAALALKADITYVDAENAEQDAAIALKADQVYVDDELALKANLVGDDFTGPVTVPDEPYGSSWNDSTQVPTKNAVYDQLESLKLGGSSVDTFDFDFSTNTEEPPNSKQIRLDVTNASDATKIWVYHLTNNNFDPALMLASIKVGSDILLQDQADSSINHRYNVIDSVENKGTYSEIPVEWLEGSNSFVNNRDTLLAIIRIAEPAMPLTGGEFTGDIAVPDDPYGPTWDGNTDVPTKNALYDKIETLGTGQGTGVTDGDKGDVVVSGEGEVWEVPELDNKADTTYVDAGLATKADYDDTVSALATKASISYVDIGLATKADEAQVEADLAEKADITYVDASLAVKADKNYVDSELAEKADLTYVDASLASKADIAYVDAGLATKADQEDLDAKADAADLDNYMPKTGGQFTGDIYVPDEAYGPAWNENFDVPTKNALYDKIETIESGVGGIVGITDGDKGDVVVSGNGEVWEVPELDTKANVEDLDAKADKSYVATQLAEKADLAYVDSELAEKADTTYVDTELAGKADITYVDSELAEKADITYVDSELAEKASTADLTLKADITYVDTELAEKADIIYVDSELAEKADTTYVDTELAGKADLAALDEKADLAYVDASLASKADVSYVDAELATKADLDDLADYAATGDVNAALALKADTIYVDTELTKKADLIYTNEQLAQKANTAYVDSKLVLKADISYVESELATKAETADVNAALDLKADEATVNAELAGKANTSDVNAALALKADVDDLDDKANITGDDFLGPVTVPDEPYGPSWDDSTQIPTKGALYDKLQAIEAGSHIPDGDKGDVVVSDGGTVWLVPDLALKADAAQVQAALDLKADEADLALKADITYVDVGLSAKADQTYVDNELVLKADQIYVDDQLADKANITDVQTALAGKADATDLSAGLNLKANLAGGNVFTGIQQFQDQAAVPYEIFGPTWDGVNTLPTKAALYTKFLSVEQAILGALVYQTVWDASTNTPPIPDAEPENKGWYYKVSVAGSTDIDGITDWQVGDWIVSNGATWDKIDNAETVSSVNGKIGAVVISKDDVGLGNADNTSDSAKPISVDTQAALDLKAPLVHTHVIADTVGLQTSLDAKAPVSHTHGISQVVGLQTELDGKAPLVHTHVIADTTGLQAALDGKALLVHTHNMSDVIGLEDQLADIRADMGGYQPAGSYAPLVHTHALADVNGLEDELDNKAPLVHTHVIADTTGLQIALDGKQPLGSYAPLVHTHVISDVSGLDDILNNKAPLVHVHPISDITNLQTTLDGKQPVGNYSLVGHVHPITEITGLQAALDSKQPAGSYAPLVHTHVIADVTNLQTSLDSKLDDSQAGTFGLALLGSANMAAAKTTLSYTKADIGLINVDNTSDLNKPVSIATQLELDGKASVTHSHVADDVEGLVDALIAKLDDSQLGQPYGVASLGPDGKVPTEQLPAPSVAGVTSFNSRIGAVSLLSGDVITALAYTPASDALFNNTVKGLTPPSGGGTTAFLRADGNWAVPPGGTGGGGDAIWGSITGTLTDQADLVNALNAKLDLTGGTLTGDLTISKALPNIIINPTSGNAFFNLRATNGGNDGLNLVASAASGVFFRSDSTTFSNRANSTQYMTLGAAGLNVVTGNLSVAGVNVSLVGHTHVIADVTGLQTALDGKQAAGSYAPLVHTHIIADVTGLQSGLNSKANLAGGNTFTGDQTVRTSDPAINLWGDGFTTNLNFRNTYSSVDYLVGTITSYLGTGLQVNGYSTVQFRANNEIISIISPAGMQMQPGKTLLVNDEAYGASWDGSLDVPAKNAVYDKIELISTALAGKASLVHTHVIADVTGLQTALDGKQAAGSYAPLTHTHVIADVTNLQTQLDGKQPVGSYAPLVHTHSISNITGLQTALDSKQPAGSYQPAGDYAASTHTHVIDDVTDLQPALDLKADTTDLNAYYLTTGGTLTGNVSISSANPAVTLNPTSGTSVIDLRGTASTNDGMRLQGGVGAFGFIRSDTLTFTNRANSTTFATLASSGFNLVAGTLSQGGVAVSLVGHTHPNFTSSVAGFAPASGGNASHFLSADGTWKAPTVPAGTVAWGAVTGTLSDQADLTAALNAKANLEGGNLFTGDQTINADYTVIQSADASTLYGMFSADGFETPFISANDIYADRMAISGTLDPNYKLYISTNKAIRFGSTSAAWSAPLIWGEQAPISWAITPDLSTLALGTSSNHNVSFRRGGTERLLLTDTGANVAGTLTVNGSPVSLLSDLANYVPLTQKGAIDGVAPLDGTGKVASAYLPSYVDDVIEVANYAALPVTGEAGKIYVTLDNNYQYRWSGSTYVQLGAAGGAAVWGAITGTLSAQTDLNTALNSKFDKSGGTVSGHLTLSTTNPTLTLQGDASSYYGGIYINGAAWQSSITPYGGLNFDTTGLLNFLTDGVSRMHIADTYISSQVPDVYVGASNIAGQTANFHLRSTTAVANLYFKSYNADGSGEAVDGVLSSYRGSGLQLNGNSTVELRANGGTVATVAPTAIVMAAGKTLLVNDEAYGASWDGSNDVPTKNALYDKIQTLGAGGGGSTSDTAYGPSWDGATTVSPSQNAVYDKIESVIATIPAATSSIVGITGTLAQFNTALTDGDFAVLAANTFVGDQTINAALTVASGASTIGISPSSGTLNLGNSSGTGPIVVGAVSGTGLITVGRSTLTQSLRLSAGATSSGNTKTIDLGTGGLAGSTTVINIGSATSTTTVTVGGSLVNIKAQGTSLTATDQIQLREPGLSSGYMFNMGYLNAVGGNGWQGALDVLQGGVGGFLTLNPSGGTVVSGGPFRVPDEAYAAAWDGKLEVPTKNAVYDKIESVIATIPAAPSTVISNTIYGAGWNGVTTIAPSQNAVYDEMELRYLKTGGTLTGNVTVSLANAALTLNPVTGSTVLDLRGTASTNDGLRLQGIGAECYFQCDTTSFKNRAGSANFMVLNSTNLAMTVPITVPDAAYGLGWNGSTQVPTKNAVYDQMEILNTAVVAKANTTDLANYVPKTFAGTNTIQATGASGNVVVEQTVGTYGGTRLTVQSVTGCHGAQFESISGLDLVDFAFKIPTGVVKLVRLEARAVQLTSPNTWEFQIGSGPAPELKIGDGAVIVKSGLQFKVGTADVITSLGGTLTGDLVVPDEAYGAGWNGSMEAPTKNAVYDKIETLGSGGGGLTDGDKGDVLVASSGASLTVQSAAGNFNCVGQLQLDSGGGNQIRIKAAGTVPTVLHRVDSANYYTLLTDAGAAASDTWNTLRPLYINLTSGLLASANGQSFGGGTTVTSTLAVSGAATFSTTVGIASNLSLSSATPVILFGPGPHARISSTTTMLNFRGYAHHWERESDGATLMDLSNGGSLSFPGTLVVGSTISSGGNISGQSATFINSAGTFAGSNVSSTIEARAVDGASCASIALHRPGQVAMHLALDGDGLFKIGGWSWSFSNPPLTLSSGGNLSLAGNVNAVGTVTAAVFTTGGASACLNLTDRDGSGTAILYNQADTFRVYFSGDQFAVTSAGNGSFAGTSLTVGGVEVVKAGLATASGLTMAATNRFLGRDTAAAGPVEELTAAAAMTILGAAPDTPRVGTSTSAATLVPVATNDMTTRTTQTVTLAVSAPTGTAVNGFGHVVRIKATAAIAVSWNAAYRAVGITLPTSIALNKTIYVGMIYNSADSVWDCVSLSVMA